MATGARTFSHCSQIFGVLGKKKRDIIKILENKEHFKNASAEKVNAEAEKYNL